MYASFQNAALLLLRLIVASIFAYAGYAKFGMWNIDPATMGMSDAMFMLMKFLAFAEPLGALALLLGILTRTASVCLAIIMIGAIYSVTVTMGLGFMPPTGMVGWSYNLMLLGACVALMAFGPGAWSVDALLKKRGAKA
jgi:putative oxidoreductase